MPSGIVEPSQATGSDQTPAKKQQDRLQQQRAPIVQRLLGGTPSLPQFLHELVVQQASMVAGTEAAAFILEADAQGQTALKVASHVRPDQSSPEVRQAAITAFQDIVKRCITADRDGVIQVADGDGSVEAQFCLITLLRSDAGIIAATAVVTRCRDEERAHQRLTSMQLVAGYFEFFTLRRSAEQSRQISQNHQVVLQLVSTVATAEGFKSAAMNLCNELASRTKAARVSVGWVKGHNATKVKLEAMSHTEQFDKKQEMAVTIVRAMEECLDQEEVVQFDPGGEGSSGNVTREAAALSRLTGGALIISVPLRRAADIVGVMTLEFNNNAKVAPQAATALAVAAEVLAPQLYDRYQNDRYLITKAGISATKLGEKALGKQYMLSKLIIAVCVIALLVLCDWVPFADLRMMHRVTAQFTFVAPQRRTVSAPFEGSIYSIGRNDAGELLKPGAEVKKGQLLLEMDLSDVKLQKTRAEANAAGKLTEASIYRADSTKQAEYRRAMEEWKGAMADVDLAKYRIEQGQVKSPIDGILLSGDLAEKVGSPVRLGEPMFEVGPLKDLQAELAVPERDIQWINNKFAAGACEGTLAATGMPEKKFDFTVTRVVPEGAPVNGENMFKVIGVPKEPSDQWLPGMEGEARLDVQKRSIMWIWTHRLIDFVKLKLWL